MYNIGAHDNHKLLSYHDNEPLRYDYHTIDIIAHHYKTLLLLTPGSPGKPVIASTQTAPHTLQSHLVIH